MTTPPTTSPTWWARSRRRLHPTTLAAAKATAWPPRVSGRATAAAVAASVWPEGKLEDDGARTSDALWSSLSGRGRSTSRLSRVFKRTIGTPTMLSLTITERSGRPRRHASNKTKTATAAPWSAAVETPAATRSKARVAAEGCTGSVVSAASTCQAWQGSDWPALRTGS